MPHHQESFLIISLLLLSGTLLLSGFTLYRARLSEQQRQRHEQAERQSLLNALPDIVYCKNLQGRYVFCNQQAADFIGYSMKRLQDGLYEHDVFGRELAKKFQQTDREAIRGKRTVRSENWLQNGQGQMVLMETQKTPLYNANGLCTGVLAVARDITHQHKNQQSLEYMAHHDALTGMGNRLLLQQQLEYALQVARRTDTQLAVMYFDLDRFKEVNDTLGHNIGDLLLKDAAQRMQLHSRESDICARLGGDEFIVVLTQLEPDRAQQQAREKCQKLLTALAETYRLQGHLVTLYASAGLVYFPQHGDDGNTLIRHADTALHHAKALGRNRFVEYHPELSQQLDSRLSIEQDLHTALSSEQFTLVYQPQFRIGHPMPRRVEVLIRWPHPIHGFITPQEFIPLAETNGTISALGFWVLKCACLEFLRWRTEGLLLEKMAVNISAIQINAEFAQQVLAMLNSLQFDPTWLELEVTESFMMASTTETSQQIQTLREHGIEFSIDDFGTGFSSLSKLKSMPVSALKIDQSFVREINDNVSDYEIARAIILMAKSLGLTVIAEGVENKAQAATLQRLGCEWIQGYFYARPMSGEALLARYLAPQPTSE